MEKAILRPAVANATLDYWSARQDLMYYRYIDVLVRAFAVDARSLIDVGSRNTPLIEAFDWIPNRVALDLTQPYRSSHVRGVKADFLTYVPERRYDFAMCLQVLEHIPDAARFARHLFDVADNVLVSVPFMWPAGRHAGHLNDPVSRDKLASWMGRRPDYSVLVQEPLNAKVSRLVTYFHSPQSPFSLKAARERYAATRNASLRASGARTRANANDDA